MRRLGLLLLPALMLPAALPAQEPAERAALDSLRAAIESVDDTTVLIARERARIGVARANRDDPFIHMELGWVAYRLGELTGSGRRYGDAASEFQWAADLRPRWPYAWYNLGLAELGQGETRIIILQNIRQILGLDELSMAARSFARALEVDPSFSSALVDLANIALQQRINPRLVVAQSALRQAVATDAGRVPTVQLMRGRIERRLQDFDSALVAFHQYLQTGGDEGIGHLELARTQAQLGRRDSTRAEFASALRSPPSDAMRVELRRDLRWLALPEELAAFDALPADSVRPWLGRFWQGRGAQDGRLADERLMEHFRRRQYAVDNFLLTTKRRAYSVAVAFRDTAQSEVDDRGVIYIRHGEPTERRQFVASGSEGNETWVYRRTPPAEDLILNFRAIGDVQDYRLVESLAYICGTMTATSAGLARTPAEQSSLSNDCLMSRLGLSPLYDRLARAGGDTRRLWAEERNRGREQAREATTTDSYAMRFVSELRPVVSYFSVADAAGRPELHVVFAVPATRLHALDAEGAAAYMLEFRLMVYDSMLRPLGSLDTLRIFRSPQRLVAGTYLTEQLTMRLPPGRHRYTLVVEETQTGAGSSVAGQALEVPPTGGGFAVSDVVMGREGSGLVWRRPEGEVPLNPLMRYPRDGAATLYYEIYGLPMGAAVETRVRVIGGGRSLFRRVFGGGGGAELAYTTTTDTPDRTRVRQRLQLAGLGPGRYQLEVELTDPLSGRRLVRRSPFEIESARAP